MGIDKDELNHKAIVIEKLYVHNHFAYTEIYLYT